MEAEEDILLKKINSMEGMLNDKEALLLYLLAKNGPGKGAIVEIGSYKGKSTVCLALGSKFAGREKVFAVDWHKGWKNAVKGGTFGEFSRNIRRHNVNKHVVPIVMKSEEAAKLWAKKKKPIRLLWIDGSHDYEDVKKDFLLWGRFLVDSGMVAFHDSFWDGPYRVVNEFILKSGNFSKIGFVDYITFAVKSKPNSAEKLRTARLLLTRAALRYPMKFQHLQPRFLNKFIINTFLNDSRLLSELK